MILQYVDPEGHKIETNQWLSSGEAMVVDHNNTVMVSEEDIYKLIFEWFSLDEAVKVSCEFARQKVNRVIENLICQEELKDTIKFHNKTGIWI